ncbi:hypothetical protein Q9L58_010412 [Maublancomyces gigas]|uniref:Uncharacterized protein n=1 Tax=Discina gigas TaxID=1032678 RepID=A0ABR3G457_9PEZI
MRPIVRSNNRLCHAHYQPQYTSSSFTPRQIYKKTKWDQFAKHIRRLTILKGAWDIAESTNCMADSWGDQIQLAIDKVVPGSKPCTRSKIWWTSEHSALSSDLERTKRTCTMDPTLDKEQANMRRKEAARKWTKAVRDTKWSHWEGILASSDKTNVVTAIGMVYRNKAKTGLPDTQGASSFYRKCEVSQDVFLPANVTTPPHIQAKWLPPPAQDISNANPPRS